MNESWAGGAINEDTQWQLQISIAERDLVGMIRQVPQN